LTREIYLIHILYKEPTRCNFGSIVFLVTARSLYMFRTLSASIIRSTKNCSSSHLCIPSRWYISSKDVQGRLPQHYVQWQPTLDVLTGYTVFARVICALFSILAAEKSGSVKCADFFVEVLIWVLF